MNPLHGQRQPSPGGNLYGYSNQQDDFSTPFNDPNSSFSDPNALFNQNFNSTFQSEFQSSGDNVAVNDSTFQNALNGHGQYAPFLSTGSENQSWQGNPYLDSNPYAFNPNVNQPSAFNTAYGQGRMSGFGNEMNLNFSFNSRDYNTTPAAPSASTISPSVINQAQQTIPPSALQANDDMWQDSRAASATSEQKAVAAAPPEGKASPSTPLQSVTANQPPAVTAVSSLPPKPMHNHDEIQAGVPSGALVNGFHERNVADYKGKAEAEKLKGWIHITKNVYETTESRLASLPEAPIRSSISQLRVKLAQSDAARLQPAAKAKLEDKLRRREKKDKSKKKKDKLALPKTTIATKIAAAAMPGAPRSSAEGSDSEDSSDSSEDESGSDYDGDSDRDDEPFPLPKEKPTNPLDAIRYEVTEAVWATSSKRLTPDALKTRFSAWLDHIQRARRDWKSGSSVTQKAEKKQLLEDLIRITAKHGHHNFVESIDQLTPLANVIAASVTELVKAEQYDDSLIEAFILLFLKISIIKWSFLLQSRLNKLLPRIVKNTKGNLKAAAELLVGKINKSEAASREPEKKSGGVSGSAVQVEGASELGLSVAPSKEKVAEIKKPVHTGIDVKKPLVNTDAKKLPAAASNAKKALLGSVQKKAVGNVNGKTVTGASVKVPSIASSGSNESVSSKPAAVASGATSKEKEKTRYVVTKPPSIFSSISASKKPSAASAVAAKTPAKEPKPAVKQDSKPEPKPEPKPAAPRAPVFSFAETLASIGKPKDEEKVKKDSVDKRPPETDEERKKRLRKEARRHLRVTWPTDDKLCQIKLFDHGLEDEIAHEAAEIADLKNEGRALKREYQKQHSKMDDFEQDFIKESDDVLDPELTDFSDIEASQKTTNIEIRADGAKPVESPESAEQKKREQGVMIAVYATETDIPFSPKEPPADTTWSTKAQYDFGDPPVWIRNRSAAEMERMNSIKASKAPTNVSDVLKNLSQFSQVQNPQPTSQQTLGNSYDPSAAISLFMSMQGNQQQSAAPASVTPAPMAQAPPSGNDLSSILSNLAALNQQGAPHTQQQDQQQQQQQQPAPMIPQQSAQSNAMPGVDPDILAFLNQYNSAGTPNTQQQQQQPAQPAQQAQSQQQWDQPAGFNLLSLLGQQQPGGQQQGGAALTSLYGGGGQWSQQQQQDLGGGGKNNKRGYDDEGTNGITKRKKGYQGVPVVPCKYWKQGKCHYGDQCTFKHD